MTPRIQYYAVEFFLWFLKFKIVFFFASLRLIWLLDAGSQLPGCRCFSRNKLNTIRNQALRTCTQSVGWWSHCWSEWVRQELFPEWARWGPSPRTTSEKVVSWTKDVKKKGETRLVESVEAFWCPDLFLLNNGKQALWYSEVDNG